VEGRLGYDEKPDWRVVSPALGALEELTRGSQGSQGSQPWCLYVGPVGPHDPFHVPRPFVDRYDLGDVPLPASYHDRCEDKPRVYQRMRRQYWDQLSEDEIRDAVRHYWAYCTMEDTYFGLVMDTLEASGQREDTLVLRLSDHGEYAGAHGLFCKGVPAFREGSNIPCIMSWPGGIERPGRTEDSFVTLADIAPTLLEVAGVPVPEGLTGRSLVPFLSGPGAPETWPDAFFSQMNGVELYYTQRVVQTHDFKYVYNGFDFDELYDLRADPLELTNLAEHPEHTEVKRELVQKMWRFAGDTQDHIFNPYATVALAPWGPADAYRAP
jgi:arylsulfatase A-like enzyme